MPKAKRVMSSILKLNKVHRTAARRAAKCKPNRGTAKRSEVREDLPESVSTEVSEDAVVETKLVTQQSPAAVQANHASSQSSKRDNGFDSPPAESDEKDREDYGPDRKVIYDRLAYSDDVLSALPNRNWAIHCVKAPEKRIVVSYMIMNNTHGTGLEPLYSKQIVIDEKLNFNLLLLNSRLVLKDKPSSIKTMHDFEDLVDYVDNLRVCSGGPAVSLYSNVNPECAYRDPLNKWRHNLCSLEVGDEEVCESCASLEEILRRHAQRNKPSLKLRNSIVVPKRKQRS